MVYLAELLVVMADGLKTVIVLARNVHRVHGHKRLDDDASLSLSRCRKATHGVVFSETQKNSSWDTLRMSGSGLWARKLSWQYAVFTLKQNLSNLTVINAVLGNTLEQGSAVMWVRLGGKRI